VSSLVVRDIRQGMGDETKGDVETPRFWSRRSVAGKLLRENPLQEVDFWIRGFNKNRKREIILGTDITPDDMMFEWTGNEGPAGGDTTQIIH
jgi:hypothetical protein